MNTKYQLQTLTCPSCAMKIKAALGKVAGVEHVEVLSLRKRIRLHHHKNQ